MVKIPRTVEMVAREVEPPRAEDNLGELELQAKEMTEATCQPQATMVEAVEVNPQSEVRLQYREQVAQVEQELLATQHGLQQHLQVRRALTLAEVEELDSILGAQAEPAEAEKVLKSQIQPSQVLHALAVVEVEDAPEPRLVKLADRVL